MESNLKIPGIEPDDIHIRIQKLEVAALASMLCELECIAGLSEKNAKSKDEGRIMIVKKYEENQYVGEGAEIEKIMVHYADGTIKSVHKGFFCEIEKKNEEDVLTFLMCHCAGDDLRLIIAGCAKLGMELGYFG